MREECLRQNLRRAYLVLQELAHYRPLAVAKTAYQESIIHIMVRANVLIVVLALTSQTTPTQRAAENVRKESTSPQPVKQNALAALKVRVLRTRNLRTASIALQESSPIQQSCVTIVLAVSRLQ